MEEKKKSPIGLILVLILLVLALGGGYYLGNENILKLRKDGVKTETNEEKKEEKKDGTKAVDKEIDKEQYLQNIMDVLYMSQVVEDSQYTVFGYSKFEDIPSGKIKDASKEDKQFIIYVYAVHNKMYYTIEGKKEGDYCYAGSGYCYGISRSDYEKINKKFGITDSFDELYSDYTIYKENKDVGDIALYTYGGWTSPYSYDSYNLDVKYEGDNLIVKNDVHVFKNEMDDSTSRYKELTLTYTFNELEDGTYALDSISKDLQDPKYG